MSKIKWLWSVAIAMGIVLIYASLSSYFIKIDDWYNGLSLPAIILPPLGMTIAWSIIYIINITVIARTIYYKYYLYLLIPICILGITNIIWCMVFFTFHSIVGAFVVLILQTLLSVAIFIMLIREDCISMIFWQVNLVWYLYLLCLIWGLVLGK
ncbi:MAG: hypothetical protein HDT29_01355 [Clostridiales bacterium]|nr:hypothetical protein [Clostridiales bacterium]